MYQILIADDEPIERAVICKTIRKYYGNGIDIKLTRNGREAIKSYEENIFPIVILDIEMPGINGLEAAKRIRSLNKECSIIFLTAFDEFSYAKQAINVRALDYLLKPVSDEELLAVLEEAIQIIGEREKLKSEEKKTIELLEPEGGEDLERIRLQAVKKMILEYISIYYTEDIALQDIASSLQYSDAYFSKLFKQCFDKNFTAYLSEYRIEKAKMLLSDITINVKEISSQVGYRDANYFARVFKRVIGVTPSEYRIHILTGQVADENITK